MEKYINNDTIVEDDIFKCFKSSLICPLCKSIYINPVYCTKCQIVFCLRCIDDWKQNNKNCPKNCEKPDYQKCYYKNEILSKLKFYCIGCGEIFSYDQAENHHNLCCSNISENLNFKKKNRKIKKLNSDEVAKLKNEGVKINNMTSK